MPVRPPSLNGTREQQNRAYDRRRRQVPWRGWYKLKVWLDRRALQLARDPLCRQCKAQGRTEAATVADHVIPHRGDWSLFIGGELQSLCQSCHSGAKQREEARDH
jgi:5-methylcytosine-specific restriction endonuclease McrA